ncbi:hypothetical protein CH330_05860 [candidate division WOR-3 bacterium JGI_Cruoil_03_51_56]|uniref:Uncharacterized protein n=1 Tax=candidate division WOR-3 bacterium JGI_Cruoil_03_51_56 TaxID=1973747 RepID=A0A235BUB4_UNCW3|nr:MAG: hypothetical protein CH330_05860 [candidate division WOR-3 bacterium JGI_Cruoil_03_51_56]
MAAKFSSNTQSLMAAYEAVAQTLDAQGVSMIQRVYYKAFGAEVWRLENMGVSGESLALEVAVLIAKWVGRGLAQAVLEDIRTQVFNVVAPGV